MPTQMNVTVEREYNASQEMVFEAFSNTETFNSFNEWMRIDPKNTKVEYSALKQGKGAYYTWNNEINVDEVGFGRLDVIKSKPNDLVQYELRFGDDPSPNVGTINITRKNDKTKVVWNFLGTETPFIARFFNKIFEGMVFEKMNQSLINLGEQLKKIPKVIEITRETSLVEFSEEKKVLALFQETSTEDKQEIAMAFQESMGTLYSYLVDDQELIPEEDFSEPVSIYESWDEENKEAKFYVGFIINKEVEIPDGMTLITIPISKVLKESYKGAYDGIGQVHMVLNDFIEKENLKIVGRPFEIFKSQPSIPDNQKVTEIYYPVK